MPTCRPALAFQKTERVDFSYNLLADPKFAFYDHSLVEAVKLGDGPTHQFFRLLSLCHTVMPEEKQEGKPRLSIPGWIPFGMLCRDPRLLMPLFLGVWQAIWSTRPSRPTKEPW